MSELRNLPTQDQRIETGPTRFGNDWCGLFIRGDNAFAYAVYLEHVLLLLNPRSMNSMDVIAEGRVRELITKLRSCDHRTLKP